MNGMASSCECTSTVTWRSCMHSSRPDWVLGEARLISSTSTTLAKIGPGPELEAALALVVDVGADDVGGQQVGRALHARELAVERARERARERGLADARVVLDEHVALGQQRDEDVVEHLVADLHGAADVVADPPRDRRRGLDLLRRRPVRQRLVGSMACTVIGDERRLKTMSRMARATSSLVALGTACSPSAVTIVTSLSGVSKPMPAAAMSLTTTASRPLRSSLPRP